MNRVEIEKRLLELFPEGTARVGGHEVFKIGPFKITYVRPTPEWLEHRLPEYLGAIMDNVSNKKDKRLNIEDWKKNKQASALLFARAVLRFDGIEFFDIEKNELQSPWHEQTEEQRICSYWQFVTSYPEVFELLSEQMNGSLIAKRSDCLG